MARGDDDLRVGFQPQDFAQHRESLLHAIGIGWQAEVERHDVGLMQAQRVDRRGTVARHHNLVILIGPAQLALQPLVILDDQQDRLPVLHAASLTCPGAALGSQIVTLLPAPGAVTTPMRPPIAPTRVRAS